jgi:hypothetical protein
MSMSLAPSPTAALEVGILDLLARRQDRLLHDLAVGPQGRSEAHHLPVDAMRDLDLRILGARHRAHHVTAWLSASAALRRR